MPNSHEKELLKQVMAEVMKEGGVENNQTKSLCGEKNVLFSAWGN